MGQYRFVVCNAFGDGISAPVYCIVALGGATIVGSSSFDAEEETRFEVVAKQLVPSAEAHEGSARGSSTKGSSAKMSSADEAATGDVDVEDSFLTFVPERLSGITNLSLVSTVNNKQAEATEEDRPPSNMDDGGGNNPNRQCSCRRGAAARGATRCPGGTGSTYVDPAWASRSAGCLDKGLTARPDSDGLSDSESKCKSWREEEDDKEEARQGIFWRPSRLRWPRSPSRPRRPGRQTWTAEAVATTTKHRQRDGGSNYCYRCRCHPTVVALPSLPPLPREVIAGIVLATDGGRVKILRPPYIVRDLYQNYVLTFN